MSKVLCPWHQDHRPSLQIYNDGVYCWVCGESGSLSKYRDKTGVTPLVRPEGKRPAEDITKAVQHILTLPKVSIRGLSLHADAGSYYILWPELQYYLRRVFEVTEDSKSTPKYLGPAGHKRPLFQVAEGMRDYVTGKGLTLVIVEGELNAMSLGTAFQGEVGIVSPGAASNFYSDWGHLPFYHLYDKHVLLVDEDRAGALAAVNLAKELQKRSKDVQCVLMRKQKDGGLGDCNEILQAQGPLGLREEFLRKVRL